MSRRRVEVVARTAFPNEVAVVAAAERTRSTWAVVLGPLRWRDRLRLLFGAVLVVSLRGP